MTEATRRVTRSQRDRVFGGVCGGIAHYAGWDPVFVRILYVALTLLSNGAGILMYLLAWMIIPLEESPPLTDVQARRTSHNSSRVTLGIVVVVVGALALAGSLLPLFQSVSDWRLLGPLALIALGVALVLSRGEQRNRTDQTASAGKEQTETADTENTSSGSHRRLVRIERGRKIAGVCAGIGDYLDVDPTLVRLLWIAMVLIAGSGILLYLIMWIVMPLEREGNR